MTLKKIILLTSFLMLSLTNELQSQLYVSAGPSYTIPVGKLNEVNDNSYGATFLLESRKFCNLWYGLRLDYIAFSEIDKEGIENYFENGVYFSPEFRYNFTPVSCHETKPEIYLQGMLTLSSIGGSDNKGRLGLGAAAGGGVLVPFKFLKRCWGIDFNALYSAPNFILKADGRDGIESLLLSISLSMSL